MRTRSKLNGILSACTGQPLERIEQDTERDNYMTAEEAKGLWPHRRSDYTAIREPIWQIRTTKRTAALQFLRKSQDEVERMIIGPGVNICNECIELCALPFGGEEGIDVHQPRPRAGKRRAQPSKAEDQINVLTPAQIKAGLDQYVIGQDAAKTVLAVSVYNHCKRILSAEKRM